MPERDPVPGTASQDKLVQEGISLQQQGRLAEAIARYRQVLGENPDHVEALHELAFAHYDAREFSVALRLARQGMAFRSPWLASFYCLTGNALDRLGHPGKAERAYRKGLELAPDNGQLHYHLAILQAGQNWFKEARRELKSALRCNPGHAAAHLALARLWFEEGIRVPATLALVRFLCLEPLSDRFDDAFGMLFQILEQLVRPGAGQAGGAVQILYAVAPPSDEGDFRTRELSLAMTWAAKSTGPNAGRPLEERLTDTFVSFFAILGQLQNQGPAGFVEKYYQPFFVEMERAGLVAPCIRHILQGTGTPSVSRWREDHPERVAAFLEWMRRFSWNRDSDP